MMLKGAGFEICDMGVDVTPEVFIDKAEEIGADVICMSALLTTTMTNMQEVITELKNRNLREKYIVMVGGAPVNESFASRSARTTTHRMRLPLLRWPRKPFRRKPHK